METENHNTTFEKKKKKIHLSVYIYCVTLIAEYYDYYAQGCLRLRKARTYLGIPGICLCHHCDREETAKPYKFRRIFFPYKYFVPSWTRTRTEKVVKYSASTELSSKVQRIYRLSYSGAYSDIPSYHRPIANFNLQSVFRNGNNDRKFLLFLLRCQWRAKCFIAVLPGDPFIV